MRDGHKMGSLEEAISSRERKEAKVRRDRLEDVVKLGPSDGIGTLGFWGKCSR